MDQTDRRSRTVAVDLVVGAALVVVAAVVFFVHRSHWEREPATVADRYVSGLRGADVEAIESSSTAAHFDALVRAASASRFQAAREVYHEVIPRIAMPGWAKLREKAERLALAEYWRLRPEIETQGRLAIAELSMEEQEALGADPELFDKFVYCAGVARLPEADQRIVGDPEVFRMLHRKADDGFVLRAAWPLFDAADQQHLGSAEALSKLETPEKLAYFDRVARPELASREIRDERPGRARQAGEPYWGLVSCRVTRVTPEAAPATRPEVVVTRTVDYLAIIEGVSREDVVSLDEFVDKHGRATLVSVLEAAGLEGARRKPCEFPALVQGGLLRRDVAQAQAPLEHRGKELELAMDLRKLGLRWTVVAVSENLSAIVD